jgi:hypothetical protein
MFFAAIVALCASDCFLIYSSSVRFDSFLFYWSGCVIIRNCVFANLTAGPAGLGGAVSIVAPIADARITSVTFTQCRAFGDFPAIGAGGACYLSTTTTAVDCVCAHNCSSGGHAHFIDLLAGHPESRHTIASSTVLAAGSVRSLHATDATLGIDGGSEVEVSNMNFTNCRVSGEGAVTACEPGSRPIIYTSLTLLGNSGQSLLHMDDRSSKPRLLHSVIVDNRVGIAVLTANYFGIDVESTIFNGNGDNICLLTNPSNYFAFSRCVFSGSFPSTWAYSPATNFMHTRTATYAISGWNTWLCAVTMIPTRSFPFRTKMVRSRSSTQSGSLLPTEPTGTVPPSQTKLSHALATTPPFEPTEWPLTHAGDSGTAGGPLTLYLSLVGGSGIAIVAGIAIAIFIWRAPATPPALNPTTLAESFTNPDSASRDRPWTRDSPPPASIPTLPGDDIDEFL